MSDVLNKEMPEEVEGADDISNLEIMFKNDVLYKMIERAGLANKVVTPEMQDKLKYGLNYRPQDAAAITHTNEGTLRGWLNGRDSFELPLYINASREGKFHILDAEAVYRIRLIYMVQKELKLSLNHIANICTGKSNNTKVFPSGHNEEILNAIDKLKEKNILLEKQNKVLFDMISSLFEQDTSGTWKLKSQSPLMLESTELYKEVQNNVSGLEKSVAEIKEELVKRENEAIDIKLEISKVNMMYKKAEYMALKDRGIIRKIFNRKPDPELIEKYYESLKKNTM